MKKADPKPREINRGPQEIDPGTQDVEDRHPWFAPQWPVPPGVRVLFTQRSSMGKGAAAGAVAIQDGASQGPYARFNIATHVGDDAGRVARNRALLRSALPGDPLWLNQVHGTDVVDFVPAKRDSTPPTADAAVARRPHQVLAVQVADCVPLLFADRGGAVVAVAHGGWRGLVNGVIENTVRAMRIDPSRLSVWLGPAIGPHAYEVGAEVREVFARADPASEACFKQQAGQSVPPGKAPVQQGAVTEIKYLADLHGLARLRLARAGVTAVYADDTCVYSEPTRFYSFRRDGRTGRMVGLIWLE